MFIKTILAAGFALAAAQANALTLTHAWELNGSTADTMAGPAMFLSQPGGLTATGYDYNLGEHASVSGTGIGPTYTLEMEFTFDALGGFQKFLDFKDFANNNGLYTFGTQVHFAGSPAAPAFGGSTTPGAPLHLVVSRNAGDASVNIYVNGLLALNFIDAGSLAVFDSPGGVISLMRNDSPPAETQAGFLDYVRTYSEAATASDAAVLAGIADVPIPGALPLLAGALGGLAFLRRRKG